MTRRLFALAVALLAASGAAAATEKVVARVNGVVITEAMVNQVVKGAIAGRSTPPSSEEIARMSDAAKASLIELELLYQTAQQRGITVSDAQVDAEIARSRARFADPADYDAALKRSGLTPATLRAETRKTLMVDALLERDVWKKVRVAPDAAQRYYDQHRVALGNKPFATLKPAIEQSLLDEARLQAQQSFVAELRKTAKIE